MDEKVFRIVAADIRNTRNPSQFTFKRTRRWSYGDVENNGVYYHPNLTHYAHQVFEEWFFERMGFDYVDLSRDDEKSEGKRSKQDISRMTFPVQWLHQFMNKPMSAGDEFTIGINIESINALRIGVRAFVFNSSDQMVAAVIWVRFAILLPAKTLIDIPSWFPRK